MTGFRVSPLAGLRADPHAPASPRPSRARRDSGHTSVQGAGKGGCTGLPDPRASASGVVRPPARRYRIETFCLGRAQRLARLPRQADDLRACAPPSPRLRVRPTPRRRSPGPCPCAPAPRLSPRPCPCSPGPRPAARLASRARAAAPGPRPVSRRLPGRGVCFPPRARPVLSVRSPRPAARTAGRRPATGLGRGGPGKQGPGARPGARGAGTAGGPHDGTRGARRAHAE